MEKDESDSQEIAEMFRSGGYALAPRRLTATDRIHFDVGVHRYVCILGRHRIPSAREALVGAEVRSNGALRAVGACA